MSALGNELGMHPRMALGALVAFAGATLLYGLTVSGHYTADGLIYALVIENPTAQTMVDPTHLLLHPLGWGWMQLWRAMGWTGRAILPLQLLNGLAGAVCVSLVWSLAYRLRRSAGHAALIAAGFALSGGLWLLSVEAEFVTIPLAMQLLVLWLVLGVDKETMRRAGFAVLVGATVGLAILSYLSSAVLLFVVFAALLTARFPKVMMLRQLAFFLGTVLVITVPTYLAGLGTVNGWDWHYLQSFSGGNVYGVIRWSNLPQGMYAFLRTLGLFPGLAMNDSTRELLAEACTGWRLVFIAYYLALAGLATVPVLCFARGGRTVWESRRRPILILAAWSIPFAIFAFYWVPGDISFWMPLLAAWWLVVSVFCARRWSWTAWTSVLGCVLLLGTVNATQVILPRMDRASNQAFVMAQDVAQNTSRMDLILIEGDAYTALNVAYFAQRTVQLLPAEGQAAIGAIAEAARLREEAGRLYVLEKSGRLREIK